MKSPPTVTELELGEVERALDFVEEQLGEEAVRPLRLLFSWVLSIRVLLQEKTLSLNRLRRLVFGSSSEKTRDVCPPEEPNDAASGDGTEDSSDPSSSKDSDPSPRPRAKRKGHGRIPASAYTGCERVIVTHDAFSPGDSCPNCQDGTLYRLKEWGMTIRLVGQPPIGGTRYEQERLRCGTCGKVQTAELPEGAGPKKCDPSVAAIIATPSQFPLAPKPVTNHRRRGTGPSPC